MDGRRWGAARPTGKPRASPPPALRHLGLSAARCRPRPLSWWGALGTWSPRAVAPLPALTASTPLSMHAPSRHPSGFSGLLTPPLSPGRTNPEGPTSPRSGALRRPRPRAPSARARGVGAASGRSPLPAFAPGPPAALPLLQRGATTPGPVLLRVRGHARSRTQVRRPLLPAAGEPRPWRPSGLFPSRRRGGGVGRRAQAGARRRTCPERGAPWLRINRGRAAWRVRAAAEGLTGMCTACGPRSVTSPARNAPRPPVCAACHSGSGR